MKCDGVPANYYEFNTIVSKRDQEISKVFRKVNHALRPGMNRYASSLRLNRGIASRDHAQEAIVN